MTVMMIDLVELIATLGIEDNGASVRTWGHLGIIAHGYHYDNCNHFIYITYQCARPPATNRHNYFWLQLEQAHKLQDAQADTLTRWQDEVMP